MTAVRDVLFVMCDQLRRDFVSCCGASPVPTPDIDRHDSHAPPGPGSRRARRTTIDDEGVERTTDRHRAHGIRIGMW